MMNLRPGHGYAVLACRLLSASALWACSTLGEANEDGAASRRPLQATVSEEGTNVADEWNQIFIDTLIASKTANSLSQRLGAIVHTAMFDAYNGIAREYEPLFYHVSAERPADARAALIAASHTALAELFPDQAQVLSVSYSAALRSLENADSPQAELGVEYGIAVAHAVLEWRKSDGFSTPVPPFAGGMLTGQWRPTPPALAPMSAQPLAFTQDFVAGSSQFRPLPPRDLLSGTYTADFDAVKAIGRKTDSTRTEEQTALAPFWEGNASVHWNQAANQVARAHELSASESLRLFTALNVAMADTAFTTWSAKRWYGADPAAVTWRPVTAIPLAESDGNPDTLTDPNWEPLVNTPAHPEYPAGHPALNGAAATILLSAFNDGQTFTLSTSGLTDQTYSSISQARKDGNDARVWGGMHFPSTVALSDAMGAAIAGYVNTRAMQRR